MVCLQKSKTPQYHNVIDVYMSCRGADFPPSPWTVASNSIPAMLSALFTEEEVRLATERRLKYLGTARVSINQIQFDPPLPRDLDPKNLDRLKEIFRKNRCRRLDVDNHIPAIVSQQDLADALRRANVSQLSLQTSNPHQFPKLGFTAGQLQALHGRHRVQAGAKVLPPADHWWTVNLYLDGMSSRIHLFCSSLADY